MNPEKSFKQRIKHGKHYQIGKWYKTLYTVLLYKNNALRGFTPPGHALSLTNDIVWSMLWAVPWPRTTVYFSFLA